MLVLVIFCKDIFVIIFDNVPLHFALLLTQMKTLRCIRKMSKNCRKMFSLVPGDVLRDPDEVFEVFVDIDSDLSMSKYVYLALVARSL